MWRRSPEGDHRAKPKGPKRRIGFGPFACAKGDTFWQLLLSPTPTPHSLLLIPHSSCSQLTPYFSLLTSHSLLLTPHSLLLTPYFSLQLSSRLPHPRQPLLRLLNEWPERLICRLPLAQHLAVLLPRLGSAA